MKDSLMTSQETSAYNVFLLFFFSFISKERAKLDCINHFSWMVLCHGFGLSVFSYEFACPMHFGPSVSGYNEGIFVHLKFIQQVFIEHQLVTLFYSSFFHVWKNGMVFSCVLLATTCRCFSRDFLAHMVFLWNFLKKILPLCEKELYSKVSLPLRGWLILGHGTWWGNCMLQPIPGHYSAVHKGSAKHGRWSSWSLTKTVWLLFNFWWFGLKLEKVPSIHISQKISVPKTLLSICQMKELN